MKPPSKWTEAAVGFLQISWAHASAAEIAKTLTIMTGEEFTAKMISGKAKLLGFPKISTDEKVRRSLAGNAPTMTVNYQGREMPLYEAHRLSGTAIPLERVRSRVKSGWPLMRALTHGVGRRSGRY